MNTEYRLGNWIIDGYGLYSKINAITSYSLMVNNIEYGDGGQYDLTQLKPIPLTEEILLKCGFEKPAYSFNGDIFHLTEWDKYPLNWCVAMNKNGAVLVEKLKYLHQLQNLYFALTGKELDIDLSR